MEDRKKEKEPNKGYLWQETEAKVIRKGYGHGIMRDEEDEYLSIVKTTVGGKDKYELVMSLGLIYVNDEESKRAKDSPDISGTVRVPTSFKSMKFGGWKRVQEDGREGTSISFKDTTTKEELTESHDTDRF